MPYQSLLDALVRSVSGAQGAVLMDSQGEVVIEAGDRHERHRLIGAYHGIALARLKNGGERCQLGAIHHVLYRYSGGNVILRPLKDGYYLVLTLAPLANLGQALYRSADTQVRVDSQL
jgi:predicted regulator of Ras-like GTPase activity (Roadblock/LC7/MglB family)